MNAGRDILWWQAEECWDQELLKWENHSPKLLFYFLLIKFGRERIELKSTGNASIQEPFKAPANGNHEEHIGKHFANLPMHRGSGCTAWRRWLVFTQRPAWTRCEGWWHLASFGIYFEMFSVYPFALGPWDDRNHSSLYRQEMESQPPFGRAASELGFCPMILVWVLEVDFTASLWLTTWLGILDRVSRRTTAG